MQYKFPNLKNLYIGVEHEAKVSLNWLKEVLKLPFVKKVYLLSMFSQNFYVEGDDHGLQYKIGFEYSYLNDYSEYAIKVIPGKYGFTKSKDFKEEMIDEIFVRTDSWTEFVIKSKYVNHLEVRSFDKFSYEFLKPKKYCEFNISE